VTGKNFTVYPAAVLEVTHRVAAYGVIRDGSIGVIEANPATHRLDRVTAYSVARDGGGCVCAPDPSAITRGVAAYDVARDGGG